MALIVNASHIFKDEIHLLVMFKKRKKEKKKEYCVKCYIISFVVGEHYTLLMEPVA